MCCHRRWQRKNFVRISCSMPKIPNQPSPRKLGKKFYPNYLSPTLRPPKFFTQLASLSPQIMKRLESFAATHQNLTNCSALTSQLSSFLCLSFKMFFLLLNTLISYSLMRMSALPTTMPWNLKRKRKAITKRAEWWLLSTLQIARK